MWRIIFLTALLYILSVESRPMESLEGPLWPKRLGSISPHQLFRRNNLEDFSQRDIQQRIYNTDSAYEMLLPKFPHDKRALAMMARWGPFSSMGKQRTPIRSNFIDPETNINTQTRARMSGQPLRWG